MSALVTTAIAATFLLGYGWLRRRKIRLLYHTLRGNKFEAMAIRLNEKLPDGAEAKAVKINQ